MYLSEEKRAQIRKCFEKQQSNAKINSEDDQSLKIQRVHNIEGSSKVSQILFNARDEKEVFTPF
ncbi:MAG: hypothetical protein PF690_13900 [Deltaproteobacteria bacterium]|jgi:hypothetical protein|nr:hypothetical protein [Deltaproteobacteria bacterium]